MVGTRAEAIFSTNVRATIQMITVGFSSMSAFISRGERSFTRVSKKAVIQLLQVMTTM